MIPFIYRGKSIRTGEFVKGDKVRIRNNKGIKTIGIKDTIYHVNDGYNDLIPEEIDPSTIGVSWGMKDKNGKDVFSNHILRNPETDDCFAIPFDVNTGSFYLTKNNDLGILRSEYISVLEIIEEE